MIFNGVEYGARIQEYLSNSGKNKTFKEDENIEVTGPVDFEGLRFVSLSNGVYDELTFENNYNIQLENIKARRLVFRGKLNMFSSFDFENCNIEEICIPGTGLSYSVEKISWLNTLHKNHVKKLTIIKREIIGISILKADSIFIDKCKLIDIGTISAQAVQIINSEFTEGLSFSDNEDKMNIEVENTLIDMLHVKNFNGDLDLRNCDIEKAWLEGFNGRLKLSQGIYNSFKVIDLGKLYSSSLEVYGSEFSFFSLFNADLDKIDLSFLGLKNGLILNTIKIVGSMKLINFDLKNSLLNNLDLRKCFPYFIGVSLTQSTFNNVKWNSKYKLSLRPIKNNSMENEWTDLDYLKSLRENYRQLKYIYSNQQNVIEHLQFKKNELETHRKILSHNESKKHREDKFILCISKYLGGYGITFIRPLILLFVIHYVLFCIFIFNDNGIDFTPFWYGDGYDRETTKQAIKAYFFLINPVHKFSYEDNNIAGVIDTLMRVFSGFFIYYIVKASRKFG